LGKKGSFNGFSDWTDLVDFQEEGIASLLFDSLLDSAWVGDEEIISDNLDVLSNEGVHLSISSPVILIERIFDGDNGILLNKCLIELSKLGIVELVLSVVVRGLEVEIVEEFLRVPEFRGSNVHTNLNNVLVA